jgi:cell division protein FtsW (lipid II flippase)
MNATADPFARVVTGAVMIWLVGQGLVNIGVVLGLLPVLGVPLPLISAGGTALISSLFGIGVVLSFTRTPSNSLSEPALRGRAR